jgi:hypothetical protein
MPPRQKAAFGCRTLLVLGGCGFGFNTTDTATTTTVYTRLKPNIQALDAMEEQPAS